VNDINPGFADTIRDMDTHPGLTRERSDQIARDIIPIGRQPSPEEVAWACAFLAAERSAAVNGTVMHVDGGQSVIG
jgi:NAD(P)-dependent dehydrogenase (short-subunit alcohol dehydrogenase family)